MGLLPESPKSPSITIGLNNIVARETRVETKPKFSIDNPSQRSNSPGDRLKLQVWPALKKSLAEGSRMARNLCENHSSNQGLPPVSFDSTKLKPGPSQSFSTKRQISLAEVGVTPMTTTNGARMDSPTIPGWFRVHGKLDGAPEATTSQSLFERSIQEPVAGPLILLAEDEGIENKTADAPSQSLRGDQDRAPVVKDIPPAWSKDSHHTVMETKEEDKPPAVPPKSPRLTKSSAAAATTISGMHNMANNATIRPRAATTTGFRPRQHIAGELHQRNESTTSMPVSSKEVQQLKSRHIAIKDKHKRTEALLVQSRDRSKKRRSFLQDQTFAVTEKVTLAQLPLGFNITDAKSRFNSSDVRKLQKQAKNQAEKFRVFQYHEVKALSKELRALDAQCDYIRSTSRALRAGRNNFHRQVIARLRSSSQSVTNSREKILGQEEALAQLDKSIDEWVAKLEEVENRRARVRQMLLEHIAASLVLSATPLDITQQSARNNEDDAGYRDIARESIRIYADCGVYSDSDMTGLLADIEHQIETMSGHHIVAQSS